MTPREAPRTRMMIARVGGRALLSVSLSVFVFACAVTRRDDVVIATRPDPAPSFEQSDGSVLPDVNTPLSGQCPTNECPAGHATCPDNPFPCGVDLSSDDDNCGVCGNRCADLSLNSPDDINLHAFMQCLNGKCALGCEHGFANCNGFVEDGCEIPVFIDENNCGQCGTTCQSPNECVDGQCACNIDFSCGTCGNVCEPTVMPPPPALPLPDEWNAWYACKAGQCYQPTCKPGFGDCNGDFDPVGRTGDGCETIIGGDPNNCGACGKKCAPGEICPADDCVCPCGSLCFGSRVESDVHNCGACGIACPTSGIHQETFCDRGVCATRCDPKWGDCDDVVDCEANLMSDPLNCGGCGIRCDGVEGQACVEGKCTTKECIVE
ncbi:MAG: Tryptophan synthase alpha chain [Labilithrix sp.]|nr:Tryptophan synthase alpha chain [Labilithrix sp.]